MNTLTTAPDETPLISANSSLTLLLGPEKSRVVALWPEYQAINAMYGDQTAKRTSAPLINHIHEGLYVLDQIESSEDAQKAFCLHPLCQDDEACAKFLNSDLSLFSVRALVFAMEYRSVANEYLSKRRISGINEIRLSPLREVGDMLIADKIQNYKDFSLYHLTTHAKASELTEYFQNWFSRLGVTAEQYCALTKGMSEVTPKSHHKIKL